MCCTWNLECNSTLIVKPNMSTTIRVSRRIKHPRARYPNHAALRTAPTWHDENLSYYLQHPTAWHNVANSNDHLNVATEKPLGWPRRHKSSAGILSGTILPLTIALKHPLCCSKQGMSGTSAETQSFRMRQPSCKLGPSEKKTKAHLARPPVAVIF